MAQEEQGRADNMATHLIRHLLNEMSRNSYRFSLDQAHVMILRSCQVILIQDVMFRLISGVSQVKCKERLYDSYQLGRPKSAGHQTKSYATLTCSDHPNRTGRL